MIMSIVIPGTERFVIVRVHSSCYNEKRVMNLEKSGITEYNKE